MIMNPKQTEPKPDADAVIKRCKIKYMSVSIYKIQIHVHIHAKKKTLNTLPGDTKRTLILERLSKIMDRKTKGHNDSNFSNVNLINSNVNLVSV